MEVECSCGGVDGEGERGGAGCAGGREGAGVSLQCSTTIVQQLTW